MKINETVDFITKAMDLRKRIMKVGKAGIGKTSGYEEAIKRKNVGITDEAKQWQGIFLCAAIEDPSTIRGYPIRENGGAKHCLFDGIYKAFNATQPTLLVFDDLGQATESTMKSIMRLIQFGEIDGKKLPEHVVIMAATNDVTDGAGVYGMIEPLKSRFHSIIPVETDVDAVVQYGLAKDWPTELLAFLRNSPDSLHDWKPSRSMHIDGACPRGWEYAGDWVKSGILDQEVIAGCVGKGNAIKFLNYRKLMNDMPDVDACLMDPDGSPVPKQADVQWLIAMAIASKISAGSFGQAIKYLKRLPTMFRAGAIRDAFNAEHNKRKEGSLPKGYKNISSSREFSAWATTEGKDIVGAID